MPNLNRVMLMGNLTRDPELRHAPNNSAVVQIGLAINRHWTDKDGKKREEATFIDAEAWNKIGEVMNQYLRKGHPVYIEGRLKLDQWEDKEGGKRSKLKVVIESFQFIDSKAVLNDEAEPPAAAASSPASGPMRLPPARSAATLGNHQPVAEDEIPF